VLADHTLTHTIAEWAGLLAVGVVGLGYLIGSLIRGRNDARGNAIEVAVGEIEVLQASRERLEGDLRESTAKCAVDIARLEGVVGQLRDENHELRQLVMMENVPPVLVETMQAVAAASVAEIGERFRAIEQGVTRLLLRGDEEPA
jgi:hypothetical protein